MGGSSCQVSAEMHRPDLVASIGARFHTSETCSLGRSEWTHVHCVCVHSQGSVHVCSQGIVRVHLQGSMRVHRCCVHVHVGIVCACICAAYACTHTLANYTHVMCLCRPDGVMRTMGTDKLLKTLPVIQNQLDVLLDFDVRILFFKIHWNLSLVFTLPQFPPVPCP